MVTSFNPRFVQPIVDGTKVHTIREDSKNRWKVGMKMHMATGVRSKNYKCFMTAYVQSLQRIEVSWQSGYPIVTVNGHAFYYGNIKGDEIGNKAMLALANADGFDSIESFFKWFKEDFTGKIIHWTELKY